MAGLLEGVLLSRRCQMTYQSRSSNDEGSHVVEPYRFRLLDGIIYLDARVPPDVGFRTFAAHLVRDVRLLDEEFKRPRRLPRHGFGVFEGAPEQVEVRFHADIAPFIAERQWHPTQKLRTEPEGTLVFAAKLSGMHEFVGWVMSWGDRAELVRPIAWRAEVRRRSEGLVCVHSPMRTSGREGKVTV
jgi:proteasome accessory factor B